MKPIHDVTATLLFDILEVAGHALFENYGSVAKDLTEILFLWEIWRPRRAAAAIWKNVENIQLKFFQVSGFCLALATRLPQLFHTSRISCKFLLARPRQSTSFWLSKRISVGQDFPFKMIKPVSPSPLPRPSLLPSSAALLRGSSRHSRR